MSQSNVTVRVDIDTSVFRRKLRAIRLALLIAHMEFWILNLPWRQIDRVATRVCVFLLTVASLLFVYLLAYLVLCLHASAKWQILVGR